MQIEHEKSYTSEYIILDVLDDYKDKFAEKMMLRADIRGLLHVDKRYFNSIEKYYYNINSYISLDNYYEERTMNIQEIINILKSVSDTFSVLSEYLLDGKNLIFIPSCIYKKIDKDELAFCFYPGFEEEMSNHIIDFAMFLMEHADSEDSQGVAMAYEYYEMVAKGIYDPIHLVKKYQEGFNIEGKEHEIIVDENKEEKNEDKQTFYFAEPQQAEEIDDNREILFPLIVCAIIILTSSVVYVYVFLHPKLLALIGIAQESYVVMGAAMAFVLSIILFFIVKLYLKKAERIELETEAIEEIEYRKRMRQGEMERLEYEKRTK